MMSQPQSLSDVVFTPEMKAEVASIATHVYADMLAKAKTLDAVLGSAGVPCPPEVAELRAELYALFLPRQAVQP